MEIPMKDGTIIYLISIKSSFIVGCLVDNLSQKQQIKALFYDIEQHL